MEFSAILFKTIKEIVFAAIKKQVSFELEAFLTRRKIESRVDDSIALVVERLLPFFQSEHLSDAKRNLLIETCNREFHDLLSEPKAFFVASLDGQKLFDQRYASGMLPEEIREEQLEDLYALIFPQIANLICAYPPAIEQWKLEGYRDSFRRLDEIATTLSNVAERLDNLATKDAISAVSLLSRIRNSLIQRVQFQLDLTGLRGDRPDAVPIEKCFIIPELLRYENRANREKLELRVGTSQAVIEAFSIDSLRCIVKGAPGSGKSTWSLWLQSRLLAESSQRLAVLVHLRDIVKKSDLPSLQELVREAAGKHLSDEVDSASVREWCNIGAVIFILDGFDEVPTTRRDEVILWIKEMGSVIGRAGLILTTRPLTTQHIEKLPSRWQIWQLIAFDEARVSDYIERWYAHAPLLSDKQRGVDSPALAKCWVQDTALAPLIGVPLMLATTLMVHHMDGELPRGRAKLYERYVDGMLGLWDSRWGVKSVIGLTVDIKKRIMTRLALHMHLVEVEQLGDDDIIDLFDHILPILSIKIPAKHVLDYLRERTGLLVGPGTWSFVHKNVGEFLVASAIRDGDQTDQIGERLDRSRLFRERHNDRWNAVLFFWAGLTSPGDLQSFIDKVIDEPDPIDAALAFGLMYDQLQPHRLSEPWRSHTLLQLLHSKKLTKIGDPNFNSYYLCIPCNEAFTKVGPLQQWLLRGFTSVRFNIALQECLSCCNITLQEAMSCDSDMQPRLWLFFVEGLKTTEDLRTVLIWSKNLATQLPTNWDVLLLYRGLWSTLWPDSILDPRDFLAILRELAPDLASKAVFSLFSSVTELMHFRLLRQAKGNEQITQVLLERLFHAILFCVDFDTDEKWLLLSEKYTFNAFLTPTDKDFDLLDTFPGVIESAFKVAGIPITNDAQNVLGFAQTLRRRRDELTKATT